MGAMNHTRLGIGQRIVIIIPRLRSEGCAGCDKRCNEGNRNHAFH
jgi:hypothetical protein